VQGNPLVAGFQEDLASDDDLGTSDRPITNVGLHAEPSSDEDVSKTDLGLLSKDNKPLTAKSDTTFIGPPNLEGSDRELSGDRQKNLAGCNVMVDSSDDERVQYGSAVHQDADICDSELSRQHHKSLHLSSEQVCNYVG